MRRGTDSSDNEFVEVGNVRVTRVPETFAGTPGVRVQAKKGTGDALFRGAELPLDDKEAVYDFVRAVFEMTVPEDD